MAEAKLYRQNHTKKQTHNTHKKRKRKKKKKYIYMKNKKRKRATKSINNLPMIISSKYSTKINIRQI